MVFDLAGSYGADDTTEEFDADTTEDKGNSWSWMDLDDLPQNVQNAYKKYDEAGCKEMCQGRRQEQKRERHIIIL